ncbi:MAG TPA: Ig-like domain repeat protein [Xanthomonadales bacterium]|nr:Ig-like domain repeat protein [Xanthomonadales bacterium]
MIKKLSLHKLIPLIFIVLFVLVNPQVKQFLNVLIAYAQSYGCGGAGGGVGLPGTKGCDSSKTGILGGAPGLVGQPGSSGTSTTNSGSTNVTGAGGGGGGGGVGNTGGVAGKGGNGGAVSNSGASGFSIAGTGGGGGWGGNNLTGTGGVGGDGGAGGALTLNIATGSNGGDGGIGGNGGNSAGSSPGAKGGIGGKGGSLSMSGSTISAGSAAGRGGNGGIGGNNPAATGGIGGAGGAGGNVTPIANANPGNATGLSGGGFGGDGGAGGTGAIGGLGGDGGAGGLDSAASADGGVDDIVNGLGGTGGVGGIGGTGGVGGKGGQGGNNAEGNSTSTNTGGTSVENGFGGLGADGGASTTPAATGGTGGDGGAGGTNTKGNSTATGKYLVYVGAGAYIENASTAFTYNGFGETGGTGGQGGPGTGGVNGGTGGTGGKGGAGGTGASGNASSSGGAWVLVGGFLIWEPARAYVENGLGGDGGTGGTGGSADGTNNGGVGGTGGLGGITGTGSGTASTDSEVTNGGAGGGGTGGRGGTASGSGNGGRGGNGGNPGGNGGTGGDSIGTGTGAGGQGGDGVSGGNGGSGGKGCHGTNSGQSASGSTGGLGGPRCATISGSVFVNTNATKTKDIGENNYPAAPNITILRSGGGTGGGIVTSNPDGTFSISGLRTGTYTVTYNSIPLGYNPDHPTNTPQSFSVTVGYSCSVDTTTGAACVTGTEVTNLNYAIQPAAGSRVTATTLSSSPNPSTSGQNVTFTSPVSGVCGPTGTVNFYNGAALLGSGAIAGGTASFSTTGLPVGNHSISATYGGNAACDSSTSATITQTVNAGACAVTTSPAVHNLAPGGTAAVTASVTSGQGSATITQMRFGSYNTTIATVNPTSDPSSTYSTTVTGVAAGATAVWATADLSDGRTCPSTGATDTDINVTAPPSTYSIAGEIFMDSSSDSIKNGGEATYTSTSSGFSIRNTTGSYSNSKSDNTGVFNFTTLPADTYTVSYTTSPLPGGFNMVNPLNGPPPQFSVSVGPAVCTISPSTSGSCIAGNNVNNLNFAINNSIPWMQTYNSDVRNDNGITNNVPSSPSYPPYASAIDALFGTTPGVIFPGDGSTNIPVGRVSSTRWVVGGPSYSEVFKFPAGNRLRTSYGYLLDNASRAGITPVDMASATVCVGGLGNCTLTPVTLLNGVYRANGNVTLNSYSFPGVRNYILLINGTLTIKGPITVPNGSTVLFAASGDIIIDKTVGVAPTSPRPTGQLQGFYSADRNFTIQGEGSCSTPDKILNIDGAIVVNAGGGGGSLSNQRNLCASNATTPSLTIAPRLDFILNTPSFLMQQVSITREVAP